MYSWLLVIDISKRDCQLLQSLIIFLISNSRFKLNLLLLQESCTIKVYTSGRNSDIDITGRHAECFQKLSPHSSADSFSLTGPGSNSGIFYTRPFSAVPKSLDGQVMSKARRSSFLAISDILTSFWDSLFAVHTVPGNSGNKRVPAICSISSLRQYFTPMADTREG